jgi:hypothetical protein
MCRRDKMRNDIMKNNSIKKRTWDSQIEEHDTAAWANIEEEKPVSKVTVPSDDMIYEAREWVDENEK